MSDNDICECGHLRSDHENGTGNCRGCDMDAGFTCGTQECRSFKAAFAPVKVFTPPPTLEQRVAALEKQMARLLAKKSLW